MHRKIITLFIKIFSDFNNIGYNIKKVIILCNTILFIIPKLI